LSFIPQFGIIFNKGGGEKNMLGKRIAQIRKQRGLIQEELAAKVDVSIDSVRRWEQGKIDPRLSEMKKLAVILDTSVAYLIGETDDPCLLETEVEAETSNTQKNIRLRPVSLEDIVRTREGMRNLQALEDRDLRAAEEMIYAMLETVQRERAFRTAQDGVLKSA
jgi:transcriptional regulator with XRE-family HTH domain